MEINENQEGGSVTKLESSGKWLNHHKLTDYDLNVSAKCCLEFDVAFNPPDAIIIPTRIASAMENNKSNWCKEPTTQTFTSWDKCESFHYEFCIRLMSAAYFVRNENSILKSKNRPCGPRGGGKNHSIIILLSLITLASWLYKIILKFSYLKLQLCIHTDTFGGSLFPVLMSL